MPFKPIEHPKCPKCGKSVYAAEEMVAGGYKFHKFCFKCTMCNKLLDSMNCCEHQAELYCKQCHGRKYGPKGVGFGIGAGALTMDTGEQFGNTEVEMTMTNILRDVYEKGLCNKLLDSCTVAEHGSELFCKQCHGRKYGPKGVGFGLGAGALTMDDGARFGNTTNEMGNRPMTAEAFTAPINPQHR
ncbi:Muscle LIM protein Mlp84B [Toxocara canis]|uniref:Muscle LIM protein Mlp84B n=1 Tax=Toxocara canis TaxID=6265 RepID=A0A0B2V4L5_TOXCA|nr:Muscle LIM protein Mlp84B [Toxocara canis]